MSRNKVKKEKIENIENIQSDDDELEINVNKLTKQMNNYNSDSTIDNQRKQPTKRDPKPRKQYNISEEQRILKAENMKLIHMKKMENVRLRNEEKQRQLEAEEEELHNKVQKRILQEKNKEKSYYIIN